MYLSLSLIVLGVFDVLGVNGQTAAAAAPPPGECEPPSPYFATQVSTD